MFTLINELHFWTTKNVVDIKDIDFGAFKYNDKKTTVDCILAAGKKSYVEKRGVPWNLSNKRPTKLKDSLKEFEDYLENNSVLYLQWKDNSTVQLILSMGLLINIKVNELTGDLKEIFFDKFLIGKLYSDYISDVVISNTHVLFTYADKQVTLIYFTKPALKYGSIRKWSNLDPKVLTVELVGPSGRRMGRRMYFNCNADMLLVWWKSSRDEVYPWSPIVRDQDRANVHIYNINGLKLDLICFYRTEFDPLLIKFSNFQSTIIHSIQQKFFKKREVILEWTIIDVSCNQIITNSVISLKLPTHASIIELSPKEDKIVIACIDGKILMADHFFNITNIVKISIIPSLIAWHPDASIFVVANDKGQLQVFDFCLSNIKLQLISDDISPSNIIDISSYIKNQNTLLYMIWNKKCDIAAEGIISSDSFLLLYFDRGIFCTVRVIGGSHSMGLGADTLISQYVSTNYFEKAISLLLNIDWEKDGNLALSGLHSIVTKLLKLPVTQETEMLLEKALSSFHTPKKQHTDSVIQEYSDSVHDLTRKFFHHLLRYQLFEKSFRLAIDLCDYDLFMDIHNYCKPLGMMELAEAALEKAEDISDYDFSNRSNSESDTSCSCSRTSCSCCSDNSLNSGTSENRRKQKLNATHRKGVPPLPVVGKLIPQPAPRQKVKFSNTVTQITVPNLQERLLPISEEISLNTVGIPVVTDYLTTDFNTLDLVSSTQQRNLTTSNENNAEASSETDEQGKIKVVHFGLV